jgi:cytochrome bd-type quinol oxidase subunit 2
MIQKLKKHMIVLGSALVIALPGLVPALAGGVVSADVAGGAGSNVANGLCTGINNAAGDANGASGSNCNSNSGSGEDTLTAIAKKVVNIFSLIVGVAAVFMIIFGGFRYITSGGDSGRVGNAKNTLIYAIVGLIIVALAQAIVHFVLNNATTAQNPGA